MEDDFHSFGVRLRHDQQTVLELTAVARRIPWTTCDGALAALRQYEGLSLPTDPKRIKSRIVQASQCTHLSDLANLACAYSSNSAAPHQVQYDIWVPDSRENDPCRHAYLSINGHLHWHWVIHQQVIQQPARFNGVSLQRLPLWANKNLTAEETEAALILRRALHIAQGRVFSFDVNNAAEAGLPSTCHTFLAVNAVNAIPLHSGRDFSGEPNLLLAAVEIRE